MRRDPNDAWVECTCGGRHWGRAGAAGLALVDVASGTLALQLRSAASHQGGSWALPGGAIGTGESPIQGALREAEEEAAIPSAAVSPRFTRVLDHGAWSYTTVVADVVGARPALLPLDGESEDLAWVPLDDVAALPLHPAFADAWPALLALARTRTHLVVDVANVVGSRPDGWWRDRVGATQRLLAELGRGLADGLPAAWFGLDAQQAWPRASAVVEGAARRVTTADSPALSIVRAEDGGDDAVVRVATAGTRAGDTVAVVTADRGLRARLPESVRALGPGTLLDHLGDQRAG